MGVTRVKEKKEKKTVKPKKVQDRRGEIREIIRVSGTDLDGSKPLIRALRKIKGISHVMSKAICTVSGVDANKRLGSLTESEIKKIEEVIKDPLKFGIPVHLANRKKDRETGKDVHYLPIEDEMAVRGMQEMEMPQWNIDVLMSFYRLTREGHAAEVSSTVKDITGNEPILFENFVKDHVKSWQ